MHRANVRHARSCERVGDRPTSQLGAGLRRRPHPRSGCKRLSAIYQRVAGGGDPYMNYKRFRRLYRLAKLQIARRRSRGRAKYERGAPLRRAEQDRLLHGRVFRSGTLLDERSRYALAVDPAFSYPSASVVRTIDEAAREHGYPKSLRIVNCPEFIASALETWAHGHAVEPLFIQPGKPTENAFIESFNSRVRDELLMPNRFWTIFEARVAAEERRRSYNAGHPHSALDRMTPEDFYHASKIRPLHKNHWPHDGA